MVSFVILCAFVVNSPVSSCRCMSESLGVVDTIRDWGVAVEEENDPAGRLRFREVLVAQPLHRGDERWGIAGEAQGVVVRGVFAGAAVRVGQWHCHEAEDREDEREERESRDIADAPVAEGFYARVQEQVRDE